MSWRVILNTLVVLVFVGVLGAWIYPTFTKTPVPCEKPIAYTIGTFDRRFNITQKDFLSALTEAENIWEKPVSKNLFIYSPETRELSVNLIYDERQEVTSTLSGLEDTLEESESNYKALQSNYIVLKKDYDDAKSAYDALASTFDERNLSYQRMVEDWNAGPRTSKKQFEALEVERNTLEKAIEELKSLETQLNEKARVLNNLVRTLNRLAQILNLNVEKYNVIGASRGETFTGGLYTQDEGGQSIDIFEFSSRDKLVRILAHELGHALGLDHNSDPKAIMYHLNEGEAESLTPTDLAALQTLCYTKDISN